MSSKPLAIDLYCGLGGWTEGLLAEGYRVVGFDIEKHVYGEAQYPAQLVVQDVLTLHGAQFKDAALIVASPPCQAYSYRAMPWKRAKALPPPDNTLFEACFRIQREAEEAAGGPIPMVVENVCGAQKWVGRARWHYGSFYLWGDVPALMPITRGRLKAAITHMANDAPFPRASAAVKVSGLNWSAYGEEGYKAEAFNTTAEQRLKQRGVKFSQSGAAWFDGKPRDKMVGHKGPAAYGSKSNARKAASAHIAKIPFELAAYIARAWYPSGGSRHR